jgi:xanthine dehydrogenase YagR molybdenum-binding subunit
MYSFGAQFVEVRLDADLGQKQVSRMVGAFGAGTILNAKQRAASSSEG